MANSYSVTPEVNTGVNTTSDNGFVSGTYTRPMMIVLSNVDAGDDSESVRIACQRSGQIRRPGDVHPGNFALRCNGVSVNQVSPLVYRAVESYISAPRPEDEDEDEQQAPWNLPAEISFSSNKSEVETDVDADDDAIVNAGTREPVTGIKKRLTDLKITVVKNYFGFNPDSIQEYNDSVNSEAFLGFPAGTVIVDDISAVRAFHNGTEFYKVTVILLRRKPYPSTVSDAEAWYFRRAVKGYYEVKSGKIIRSVDGEKMPVSTPVYLDKTTGERLADGDPIEFETTKIFESKDLNQMGL